MTNSMKTGCPITDPYVTSDNLPDTISIIWSVEDVAMHCENLDFDLTLQEQRLVLQCMEHYHDADTGINWQVMEHWMLEMIRRRAEDT